LTALLVTVSFAAVVCVGPLAFYLCWLASVNRRDRPTVVSGAWDFVGVVGAASGFLLVGGLLLLSIVQNDPRLFARGDFQALRTAWEFQWLAWIAVFAGYVGLIALGVWTTARRQGTWLSVYNVEAEAAAGAVETALERSGLPTTRVGNRWHGGEPLVELAPFHGTRHVTIRIVCKQPQLREEVERHLRPQLAEVRSPENPAAAWFSAVASGSVLAVVGFVGVVAYSIFFRG
jgi:hypothetical protein